MKAREGGQIPEVNCIGKDQLTLALARFVAGRMSSRHDSNMKPYKCPHCGTYHVGEVTGKRKPNGRPKLRR